MKMFLETEVAQGFQGVTIVQDGFQKLPGVLGDDPGVPRIIEQATVVLEMFPKVTELFQWCLRAVSEGPWKCSRGPSGALRDPKTSCHSIDQSCSLTA